MKRKKNPSERLVEYRSKRSPETTSEPFGSGIGGGDRLFVVQMHAARRLHWDLRLEWGGTLLSWAVPHGFTRQETVQHLAVRTEDHPIEYADFEGVIPAGNYGAGSVIVWDRGHYRAKEDLDEALKTGILHVEFFGYKLRGVYLMVKTSKDKSDGDEWLLRKKADEWSTKEAEKPFDDASVLSGLTVEELTSSGTRVEKLTAALDDAAAPKRHLTPADISLMLASTGDKPFTDPAWLFELKYDGYRLLAYRDASGKPFLRSRGGHDITRTFPEVARAVAALPYPDILLDGELVVLEEDGRPNFHHLQLRSKLTGARDIANQSVLLPCTYFAFDLLACAGYDLRPLALRDRKAHLASLAPRIGAVRFADHIDARGEAMFEHVKGLNMEGIMAKRADSPYRGTRSSAWLKLVHMKTDSFAVVGFTAPTGNRSGFGALHLAYFNGGDAMYAGRVGSGFSDAVLSDLATTLAAAPSAPPPAGDAIPTGRGHSWVAPTLVVDVRYKEWTPSGHLRQPVFLDLRSEIDPTECVTGPDGDAEPPPPPDESGVTPNVEVSRPEKVFWPDDGFTKGDLVDYYRAVAPWLLPVLKDRPLVLTRYPDGIAGKSFYQKNAPTFIPDWIETVPIHSDGADKDIHYIVCQNEASLVYLANSAAIPLHVWPSRRDRLQHPDWCVLDLDPKDAPFAHVVTLAKAIHTLAEEIGLPTAVKTSGSSGLHVLIPLGGQCTFDQSRMLGQLLATVIERRHADIATTERVVGKRQGKVYLDYLQNRHGQLLVAPYSVRALPGAPVSAPLRWREVNGKLTPRQFTIRNLVARLKRQKSNPFDLVLTERPDLVGGLSKLQAAFDDD